LTPLLLKTEIFIEASPAVVFKFLIDPQKVRRWIQLDLHLSASHWACGSRPGGLGDCLEAVPNSRIVVAWPRKRFGSRWLGETRIQIDLRPERTGTRLHLRQWRTGTL